METTVKPSWKLKGALTTWGIIILITVFGFSLIQLYFVETMGLPQGVWVGLTLTEIGVAMICLLIARYRQLTLEELGIKRPSQKWIILAVILAPALLVIGSVVILLQISLFGDIPTAEEYARLLIPTTVPALLIWVLIDILVIGPAEELFARGLVQTGLQNSLRSETLPIVLSGLLFGIWHLDPFRIAAVSVVGMGIAYVFKKSDNNLVVAALLHGVYDAFTMTLAFIGTTL